jgi:UDP-glucose:(heptosyl)LPS alpha-1,3-glucosyltransferase
VKLAVICRPFAFHGGLETATAGLIGELVRQGLDLHLLTTAGQSPSRGVTVHRLPVLSQPSLARLLSFALSAGAAVRDGRYDIVQSHERTLVHDLYRAGEGCHKAYLEMKARRLTTARRLFLRANPYHRVLLALERRIFDRKRSARIVAISRRSQEEIERLYGLFSERVTLIYNGVDLTRFSPENRQRYRARTRSDLGIGADHWLILFVGSGFQRKGLGPLIEGVARLPDRRARLCVVGKGGTAPYREEAERLGVQDRVVWAGPHPDVDRFYAAADLVALPALYEPFGNVHLEALASGLPVLASSRSGGAEVITPGRTGWIVDDPEDPAQICRGLQALREGDTDRYREAARAAAEPFTYEAQARAFIELYKEIKRR